MSENSTKRVNFISGSARKFEWSNGDVSINLDIKLEDLQKLPVNDKGYIKIVLKTPKGGKDKFGNDFSIQENTYKPDPNKVRTSSSSGPVQAPAGFKNEKRSDYPF